MRHGVDLRLRGAREIGLFPSTKAHQLLVKSKHSGSSFLLSLALSLLTFL
jgi:hypothetical protein